MPSSLVRPLLYLLLLLATPLQAQVFLVTANPDTLGAIPDGGIDGPGDYGPARFVEFEVSGTEGLVGGITVEFSANHPFVSDLRARLIAPNGFLHELFAQSGITVNSNSGFPGNLISSETYSFSDQASLHWWELADTQDNGIPVDLDIPGGLARTVKSGGQSEPDQFPAVTSMDEVFLGTPMDGTWRLVFDDGWSDFEGEITAASLIFEFDSRDRVVSNANDSGPGSLRQAMLDAQSGETIGFDANFFSVPRDIELSSALPQITQPVLIQGPGAGLLSVARESSAPPFPVFSTSAFEGTFAISGLRIFGGASFAGGAIDHSAQYLRASGLDIDSNSGDLGGGISIQNATAALLIDSTLRFNGAGSSDGSGVYASCTEGRECIFAMVNSTVSSNAATSQGSVTVVADRGATQRLQLFNSTIVSDGVGVRLAALETGGTTGALVDARMVSNLFRNGVASVEESSESVAQVVIDSLGDNLSNLDEPALFDDPSDLVAVDPLIGPLGDNGGPTPTHALLAGSPAIDAGGNPAFLAFDQRGPGFPRVAGEDADIGAFEAQPEDRIFSSRFELVSDVVVFENVDFSPNEDFTGGSIRWLDGATCDCDTDEFDFNIFGDASTLRFFWARSLVAEGGVSLDGSTYAVLASGDIVGPASDFITDIQAAATAPWSPPGGVTGYLGFRFEDAGQVKYGYALISTGTNGRPFTLLSYAFDNGGAPIVIP